MIPFTWREAGFAVRNSMEVELKRRRIPRARLFAFSALAVIASLSALQLFDRGRVVTVRSYVRAERAWAKYFPVSAGKPLLRRAEPLLFRIGMLRPVRVEVEPGCQSAPRSRRRYLANHPRQSCGQMESRRSGRRYLAACPKAASCSMSAHTSATTP